MEVALPPGGLEYEGAPRALDELERVEVLQALELLKDYSKYPGITAICTLLKECLSMFIAGVSVVGQDCILFRATPEGGVSIFPINVAVGCTWLLVPERPEVLVIEDLSIDPRTCNNPYVLTDPCYRFYAGAPLISSTGTVLGTLCVLDVKPRQIGEAECRILMNTSECVVRELERARFHIMEKNASRALLRSLDAVATPLLLIDASSAEPPARIVYCNQTWAFDTGDDAQELLGKGFWDLHKPSRLSLEEAAEMFQLCCLNRRDFTIDIQLPHSLFSKLGTVTFRPADKAMIGGCMPALTYKASGREGRPRTILMLNLYFAIMDDMAPTLPEKPAHAMLEKPARANSTSCVVHPTAEPILAEPEKAMALRAVSSPPNFAVPPLPGVPAPTTPQHLPPAPKQATLPRKAGPPKPRPANPASSSSMGLNRAGSAALGDALAFAAAISDATLPKQAGSNGVLPNEANSSAVMPKEISSSPLLPKQGLPPVKAALPHKALPTASPRRAPREPGTPVSGPTTPRSKSGNEMKPSHARAGGAIGRILSGGRRNSDDGVNVGGTDDARLGHGRAEEGRVSPLPNGSRSSPGHRWKAVYQKLKGKLKHPDSIP